MVICQFNNCKKTAMYNIKSENNPKFCSLHKTDDMFDKKHKL